MKALRGRSLLLATSMLAVPILAAPAFAEQAASGGIQEIVVTAQREAQSVLSVPMSIQAVSGDQLLNMNIETITDLQYLTPGFYSARSAGYTQVFIRGVGNSIFVGADPSVATYIDDVPDIYGSMLDHMSDVERVEVLKGAQGGLYGRNATGGVENIITKQPNTDKFSGDALADYGEYNTLRLAGYVNVPINDKFAFNASIERDRHDGYYKNVEPKNALSAADFTGNSALGTPAQTAAVFDNYYNPQSAAGKGNFWATDGKILVKPSDNFKVTIKTDYARKEDDTSSSYQNPTPAAAQAAYAGYLTVFAGATPNLPPGFTPGNLPKYDVGQSLYYPVNNLEWGTSITGVYNAPGFDVTSISSYRFNQTYLDTELSGSAPPIGDAIVTIHRRWFYQELRAVSTDEGPIHWLAGGTYLKTHVDAFTIFALLPPVGPQIPLGSSLNQISDWSIYAQGGYDITHELNLTVSGRYEHEGNNAIFGGSPGVYAPPTYSLPAKKFLPAATVSYKLEDGGNLYARYARGFKEGGINPVANPAAFPDPYTEGGFFKGETVDTFETGYRQPLMDHRLDVTAAAFYNRYSDLQTSAHAYPQYAAIIEAIINAGSARTWGFEGSVNYKVIDALTIGVNAGYLNAKYINFQVPATNPVIEPFNLNGHVMPFAPKLQIAFTADLDQPLNDKLNLVGNILESHLSKQFFLQSGEPGVLPEVNGPGYWITNLKVGVKTSDGKYGVYAYANNLFNALYYTYGSSSAADGNLLAYGNPRVAGGEIEVKF